MQFNSLEYGLFLALVVALYYRSAKTILAQKVLIVAASALFYAFWSVGFLVHFFGMVTVNYWASLWMERASSRRNKLVILSSIITLDLLNLVIFKYAGLIVSSANWVGEHLSGGSWFHVTLEITLPLAISFYTFHVISFLVDVYHGHPHAKPACLLDFLFYVTMFPHQIAGPILRGHELFPQLEYKKFSGGNISLGCQRLLLGLFQKAVIADNLAIVVDHGYGQYESLTPLELYVVLIAYSFQIFFDFAGYTNMGIGSARLFGYALPENFNVPYLADSVTEFWRRWHMTLSRWIRDYIFIPLGGSRGTQASTAANLTITMALAGLWHGASWTFLVWGVYHGFGLVVHHAWAQARLCQSLMAKVPGWLYRWLMIFVTFHFVTVGWVLFRSPDFATAGRIFGRLSPLFYDSSTWTIAQSFFLKSYGFTAIVLYGFCLLLFRSEAVTLLWRTQFRIRLFAYGVALYLVFLLAPLKTDPFIYFQF